nr:transposase [Streptomyces sp. HP-A2021]
MAPGCRGSEPSRFRVIDCEITLSTSRGHRTTAYRLVTTLTDASVHPAGELIKLYHKRWEVETAYLEIKSTILGGRVLRARTPAGVAQEVFALLVTYQVLRLAMADATATRPGTDPDRASFTIALNTARDLVIQAASVFSSATRRHHRPPHPGQPHARPAHPHTAPRRQTGHLEVQRQRHCRPDHLQGHHRHRHPRPPQPVPARPVTCG